MWLHAHYRLEAVVDVRPFPGLYRHPQFAQGLLRRALAGEGIAYHWIVTLAAARLAPLAGSPCRRMSLHQGFNRISYTAAAIPRRCVPTSLTSWTRL